MLYEVINEGGNADWNEFVVRTVQDYEKTKPKQHPIGITGSGGVKLEVTMRSACDWVSPGPGDSPEFDVRARANPPLWDGRKVCVLDTDHVWGHGIDYAWVWKSFLRGHNVLFMDPWARPAWYDPPRNVPDYPGYWEARKAMRNTAIVASRCDMAGMLPSLIWLPRGIALPIPAGNIWSIYPRAGEGDRRLLLAAKSNFTVEWIHPIEGGLVAGGVVKGGGEQSLACPFANDAVVHLRTEVP